MESRKLLFLLNNFLDGGTETVAITYINNIARCTPHHVTLAIALNTNEQEVFLDRIDSRVRVVHLVNNRVLTFRRRRNHYKKKSFLIDTFDEVFLNPVRRFLLSQRIGKLAVEHDVVIDFDCRHGAFLKKSWGKRVIAFFHFSLDRHLASERRRKRFVSKMSVYDKLVLVCNGMYDEALKMCPEMADKLVRIYNPVDLDALLAKAGEPVGEALLPLFDKKFVLAVERLEENQKDVSTLIRAFCRLKQEKRNGAVEALYIIGEGASRSQLEALIAELGAQPFVKLLGFIANPQPFISKASFLVHSAKYEGFGLVLLEALMQRKVVVASDCPVGPREILNGGKAGFLVPVGDVAAMADTMAWVIAHQAEAEKRVSDSKEHIASFLPEASISALEQLF